MIAIVFIPVCMIIDTNELFIFCLSCRTEWKDVVRKQIDEYECFESYITFLSQLYRCFLSQLTQNDKPESSERIS